MEKKAGVKMVEEALFVIYGVTCLIAGAILFLVTIKLLLDKDEDVEERW